MDDRITNLRKLIGELTYAELKEVAEAISARMDGLAMTWDAMAEALSDFSEHHGESEE